MSNYTQTTLFGPKDTLPTNNPAKTIFGAAYDVEFGNIATAISSKRDSAGVVTVTSNTGLAASYGANIALAASDTGQASRLFIGDTTGWTFDISARTGSVTTDLFRVWDNNNGIFGRGPNSGVLTDMTPDANTFTITYTGFTAGTTGTAVWSRQGNQVTLVLPFATNTSNAASMSATGIPNAINPARQQYIPLFGSGAAEDNGTTNNGLGVIINTNNTITFALGSYTGVFTASGTKGILHPLVCTYLLN